MEAAAQKTELAELKQAEGVDEMLVIMTEEVEARSEGFVGLLHCFRVFALLVEEAAVSSSRLEAAFYSLCLL